MYFVGSILVKIKSKLKSICFKCANFLAEKIPKEKKKKSAKIFKCECCCNVLGGPKENRVKFYQENYRVKITNSIKRGRRGKSRVNLVLGVRNSALGAADLPWVS